jgi:16S rRNA processing protein RimM
MAAQMRQHSTPGSNKTAAPPARNTSSGAAEACVCVGAIAAAHGIKGEVKIKSFTADPLGVGAYGPVSDETGARQFRLSHLRAPGGAAGDSVVVARIEGVSDRNAAEALRGLRLYVPRAALPAADPDEYYHHDLIGLTAVLVTGERLGTVRAVDNFGAGDLLDIARDDGSSVVVPFTNAVVPTVDIAAGKVVIDPPEGLLDKPDEGEPSGEPGGEKESGKP